MSTERLLEIKSQIDDAKSEQSKVAGQIIGVEDQMMNKFEVKTTSAAKKELETIGNNLDNKETEFKREMDNLENAYPWE